MNVQITGEFLQDGGYSGLIDSTTRQSLTSMLDRTFPKGSILKLTMTVAYAGARPLCSKRGRYSGCNTPLNEDGTCPNVEDHEVVEEEEPSKTSVEV